MKKNNILKAFTLSMIMILGLVMPMTAQNNDYFFRSYNNEEDLYENRGETAIEGAFWNQQFGQELPLGSGLLIMVAAGAGYAVSRRRRSMRKAGTMLLALAMILTFTQCKKTIETVTTQGKTFISLDVENNSRYDINLETGAVTYQEGDAIYVINDGKVIGGLECDGTGNGKHFVGALWDVDLLYHQPYTIDPSDGLHFFFVGDVDPDFDENTGALYVDMSNQSVDRPLLSYGHCAYDASVTKYRCGMRNKCALVKFELTDASTDNVTVNHLHNTAQLLFTGDIVPTEETGSITLHKEQDGTLWAYLLEQDAITTSVKIGDNIYKTAVEVPAIQNNDFWGGEDTSKPALEISNTSENLVVIDDKMFSVGNGKYVYFSSGNLQYRAVTGPNGETAGYSFASPQYTFVGSANKNISSTYDGLIDLFGWGTGTNPCQYSTNNNEYSTYNEWGSQINDGNDWYTLSNDEWNYLFNNLWPEETNERTGKYAPARIMLDQNEYIEGYNWVNGLVIIPDNFETPAGVPTFVPGVNNKLDRFWDSNYSNIYTKEEWELMEDAGAVFMPDAGDRTGNSIYGQDNVHIDPNDPDSEDEGFRLRQYWTSTPYSEEYAYSSTCKNALFMYLQSDRAIGRSVRLVRTAVEF